MVRARALTWLFAWALVLAQSLAFVHGVVHLPRHGGAPAAQAPAGAQADWVKALFAGHDDDSGCRLYDSLGHTAPPAACTLAVPAAIPPYLLPLWAGEALARWATLFDARGPPSLVR